MPFDVPLSNFTVEGRIGVGTDTPTEKLEVKGNIKLNAGVPVGEFSSDGLFTTPGNQSVPTTLAVKTYVDNQRLSINAALDNKAEKNGALTQDFQVNNLTAQADLQVSGTVTANKFIGNGSSLTGLSGVTQWRDGASGSIFYSGGKVGIGTATPDFVLDAGDRVRVRQGASGTGGIWFYQTAPAADRAFVGMASDTQVGFYGNTGASWGLVMDTTSGQVDINKTLKVNGNVLLPNSGGGNAVLTAQKYNNEASFKNNNVKLSMASRNVFGFPGAATPEYEFAIGETFTSVKSGGFTGGFVGFVTNFIKRFSINQNGDLYCAGAKAGFVADYFVNRVGDTLEQGDVVVISSQPITHYSGSQNDIPILEVDLTAKAYDSRVCGIVSKFVTEQDLPFVEIGVEERLEDVTAEMLAEAEFTTDPVPHPLQRFAAIAGEDANPKAIQDQQMGMMVTLGSFAHCKVDADIAPIAVGDLLTTSPTKGHAQKVLDPSKALGTIVGKALAPLDSGKGKIPILVMLQ